MKILDYFYYTFYELVSNIKRDDTSEHTAYALFGSTIYLNFISLLKNFDVDLFNSNKFINLLIGMIFIVPLYFLFVKNEHYKAIIERYKTETETNKIIRNVIVWGYFIFSIIWTFKSFWNYAGDGYLR